MSIVEAIILGIIQGLTEFIPVSSSGHLVVMRELLGITRAGLAFDVALHLGTLLALMVYFWDEVKRLFWGLLGRNDYRPLSWLILFATVPAAVAGVLLQGAAETSFRSVTLVAASLLVIGLFMIAAEYFPQRYIKQPAALKDVTWLQALAVGIAQVLALVPGVSRSGSTITAGLFSGLGRIAATRFSFLLAIPITFGAIVKVLADQSSWQHLSSSIDLAVIGVVTAFVSGIFAIRFLLSFLSKHSLRAFAYYRIVLAVSLLLFVAR